MDHNQYIKDGLSYQSNYQAGLRVYDISSIPEDPSGDSVCEVMILNALPSGPRADRYHRLPISTFTPRTTMSPAAAFPPTSLELGPHMPCSRQASSSSTPRNAALSLSRCLDAIRAQRNTLATQTTVFVLCAPIVLRVAWRSHSSSAAAFWTAGLLMSGKCLLTARRLVGRTSFRV